MGSRKSARHDGDEAGGGRRRRGGLKKVVTLVTVGLSVAAVVKELRKPEDERTWNGTVAMVVPYDFRFPTLARIRERMWDPEADHVIGPRVFGVGWTLNVGRIVAVVGDRLGIGSGHDQGAAEAG